MKRYIGNYMSIYVVIAAMVIAIGAIVFAGILLSASVSVMTVILAVLCIIGAVLPCAMVLRRREDMAALCEISKEEIVVKPLMKASFCIVIDDCADIGIGYYHHGAHSTGVGADLCYFYFSREILSDAQKRQMNTFHSSPKGVKIAYNRKTFDYLLRILPKTKANRIKTDAHALGLL